jgi:cytochrome c oxidase cbb3-type subunit 3
MKPITLSLFLLITLLPGLANAEVNGAKLYAQNCAACHGDNGNGGIGVPLALPSFQSAIDDTYIRKTIQLGRPGRIMPSFSNMSHAEINAIVRYVRSWNKTKPISYSKAPIHGNVAHGAKLFSQYCASCHGTTGEGGKGTGVTFSRPRDLPIMAPALNNPGFLAAASDAMIKDILMKGRNGTPMRSFLKQGLTERDIDDVVSYVRSFEKKSPAKSAKVLHADQPVFTVESPYDFKTTVANLRKAISSNNFILIREQELDTGLVPEGKENKKQHIVYFCNFDLLNKALATDPRVGLFLPCRITVVEVGGKVKLMSVNPKRLSEMFNNSELNDLCDQMTQQYQAIMEEATL